MDRAITWLARQRRAWLTILIASTVGIVVAVRSSHPAPEAPPQPPPQDLPLWGGILLILCVLSLVFGALAGLRWRELNLWKDADRRAARIHKLSSSLQEALTDITAIQREVDEGTRLLARLQAEMETSSRLAALSEDEAAAVRELVQGAVRHETAAGTRLNIIAGLVLFAAGVVVTLLLQ